MAKIKRLTTFTMVRLYMQQEHDCREWIDKENGDQVVHLFESPPTTSRYNYMPIRCFLKKKRWKYFREQPVHMPNNCCGGGTC